MVLARDIDPSASPLDYYSYELRRLREEAGLKQAQLGAIIFCTGSLIGMVENGRRVPTRDFSERVDAALGTGGVFSRLVGLVLRTQLPNWFQAYAEMEARATHISSFQPQLVYGLLQTERYARAVLHAGWGENLDDAVAARLERQRILGRERPPLVWVVLDEAVLHRQFGSREIMREQLDRLLEFQHLRAVRIQIIPFSSGQHPATVGAFNVLRFEGDPDIVYAESYGSAHVTANPETTSDCAHRYDHLQAAALSMEKSAELIARVREERYGDPEQSDGRALA
ncbi:helix-turn-helix transcriptional regulator [Streptomyces sp. NPDC059979]|uniref:helix-turn-helix domain-containing protein n=1 Tax=Streptomyces sp. NPDC059979 TaxID=3347021 RepID=UPI0036B9AF5F